MGQSDRVRGYITPNNRALWVNNMALWVNLKQIAGVNNSQTFNQLLNPCVVHQHWVLQISWSLNPHIDVHHGLFHCDNEPYVCHDKDWL